ncbi:MAG: RNA methyltransferase [Micrococcaceae bacterium]
MDSRRLDNNVISNPRSERVKGLTKLSRRSVRYKQKKFLVEGPQSVREALKYHKQYSGLVRNIYLSAKAKSNNRDIYTLLKDLELPIFTVTEEILDKISPDNAHQGWIAECNMEGFTKEITALVANNPKLLVYLENLRDPGNVGTIIRVADAAGASGVILSAESVDIFNSKVIRSTAGSLFHLPIVLGQNATAVIASCSKYNIQSLATDGYSPNNLFELESLSEPTLWVMGNEAHGATDEIKSKVDKTVSIPVYGQAESLNVATAATICLYVSAKEQH